MPPIHFKLNISVAQRPIIFALHFKPIHGIVLSMSTVQELEMAIPQLSAQELADFRAWFEEFCEDRLELTDEVKAKLDQAHQEVNDGRFRTRQPQ